MSHKGEPENMSEDYKTLRKAFFDMTQMVKVLYEERNTRLQQGESLNPPKGDGDKPPKGDGGYGDMPPKGHGDKPPLTPPFYSPPSSPPSSPSSSSTSTPSQAPSHSPNGHGKTPFLKLDIKFELPVYNGEVNGEKLDNWVRRLELYCNI